MKLRPSLSLILVWMMLLTTLPSSQAVNVMAQKVDQTVSNTTGLRFRLSEGAEQVAPRTTVPPVAVATRLSEVESNKLLARLPALKPEDSDTVSFKFRE